MELLFKKYFWLINSLFLLGFGFATSRTLSAWLELEVLKVPFVEAAEQSEEAEVEGMAYRRPAPARSVDLDRRRELTAQGQPPENQEEEVAVGPSEPMDEGPTEPLEPEAPPREEINLEFVAAVTTSDEGKNMALVRIDGGNTRWVGIEDELKPGYKVTRITNYYIAASEGVTELLWEKQEPGGPMLAAGRPGMGGPAPRAATTPSPPPAQKEPETASPTSAYAQGIKQTGPMDYQIDRNMLNEQLQDLGKLGREARVIPNYDRESGTYKGFKLIGVRPNSLYRAIGIRSGDVIARVNGAELSSPGKALELFNQLQTSNDITLDLVRRGKEQTLTYKIE